MIPHNRPTLGESDVEALARVIRSGQIAQGPEVSAFEEEMAGRFGGGRDAVAVSSGTAALYLALKILGVGPGDRVLMPTYVCTALVHATRLAGAEPALGDVRESDFNLDDARPLPAPKAVILPHIYGVPSDPARFQRLGVPLIEDAAQAAGARFGGRSVGSFGELSVFSFYATKPLTCGQGGMVLGSREACEAMRDRRDYDGKRQLAERFNYQMTDLQAALGRDQLRRFDSFLARRRETAALYAAALPGNVRRQEAPPGAEPNHFRFVVRLREVDAARERFQRAGITTIVPTEGWELLHRQLGIEPQGFGVAETLAQSTLSVPLQPSLSDGERRQVASVLETLGDLA